MSNSIKFFLRHTLSPLMVALLMLFSLTGCGNSNQTGPAIENLAKGKAFMEQNKLKDDVVTLENGIQYRIITKGSGKFPKLADVVIIHYRGKHLDGTIFSDSYKEDKPEQILVKHAILGWKKIMPLMSVGSKWTIYLPPHMAFSNRGFEDIIEPNETLTYEIELVGIAW
ncbi:MAG: FKBP-type peptidyl-prolyl cis-trans isomerase [Mariprofundaceae bacterium]